MNGKVLICALVALGAASTAAAQVRLENDRWDEDWSDTSAPYKNMPFGPFRVDLGADLRWRAETVQNPRFGLTAQDDDAWLQQRLMAHANLRAGDTARLFVQWGAFDVIGRNSPGDNDDNRLDLQQGFVDLTPAIGGSDAQLRLGRQELGYDFDFDPRFLGAGDGANIRRRFDGGRLTLSHDAWRLDAISINPVSNQPGAFDDAVTPGEHIYGGFIEHRGAHLLLRAYAFDHARRSLSLAGVTASDRRRSYGLLFNATQGAYALDLDGVRQTGSHGAYDVEAWSAYAGLTRTFSDASWSPRLTARLTYNSGDSDAGDATIETYAPPIPRNGWFSDGGFFSTSNVAEAALVATLQPRADVRLDAKLAGVWRANNDDFIYVASHTALAGSRGGDAFIGIAPRLQLLVQASRHVTLRTDMTAVFVSDRIAALGGKDGFYAAAHIALRY